MNYKLLSGSEGVYGALLIGSDGSQTSFPFHPDCTDYQAYLRWLEEGNEPLPAEEPAAAEQPAED